MERYKPWTPFLPIDLAGLCTKIRCNPGRRDKILAEHLQMRRTETVYKNLWTLVGLFPWGLSIILDDHLRGGTPTIPMIKRLMTLHYDIFKQSTYFDEKYLEYKCIGYVDAPAQVKHFIAHPTTKGKRRMDELYCHHDERVRHSVDAAELPAKMRPQWGIPFHDRLGPIEFYEYECDIKTFVAAKNAAKLTTGGILMRIVKTANPAVGRTIYEHGMWGKLARLIDSYGARPSPKCPRGYYKLFE